MVFTIDELCEYLGICKTTLWSLRKKGLIPYFTVGSRVLFNKDAIDEWMAKGGTKERENDS